MFTAPLKICKGRCNMTNVILQFPLIIRHPNLKYKEQYERDFEVVHSKEKNAPFKTRSTYKPFQKCDNNGRSHKCQIRFSKIYFNSKGPKNTKGYFV